jgi:hypothetical protein
MNIQNWKRTGVFLIIITLLGVPHFSFADTVPPGTLVGSARDHAVFLQWNDAAPVTNHTIEYKPTSGNTWTTFSHPVSPASGITVTNLTNGVSYDFRVSAISAEGQSSPSAIASATPLAGAIHTSNNQIISTGQSLAEGSYAFPVLSTTQPYGNLMLNAAHTALIPLVEPVTGGESWTGETISSALANMVTSLAAPVVPNYTSIVSLSAQSGTAYTGIKRGTPTYDEALTDIVAAKELSLAQNKTLVVRGITVIHGETDEYTPTSASQYEQNLVEWQNDYQSDARAITGQEEPVLLFTDQMSSWTSFGSAVPHVALGQYAAAKNNPDKIIMVTPKYIFDSVDWLSHMTNYSQRRLGEYYAKVYKKVVIDGEQWKPLMPETITMYGNVIHAQFHVPVGPLVFDTNAVMAQTNYGFEYADSFNSAYITNVQIISPDTVAITLSQVPTGPNPRLRYAYTGTVGAWTGSHIAGAARGNLRDSDMTPALHQDSAVPTYMGNYLHNWALTFDEPVTLGQSLPNEPTNISAAIGPANGTAIVSFTPPTNTGIGAITSYIITSTPGNITATGNGSPITITGLSNHTTYTFTVTAVNSAGQSVPSASSNAITLNWPTITVAPSLPGKIEPATNKRPVANKVEKKKSNVTQLMIIEDVTSQKATVLETLPEPRKIEESKESKKEIASIETAKTATKETKE